MGKIWEGRKEGGNMKKSLGDWDCASFFLYLCMACV